MGGAETASVAGGPGSPPRGGVPLPRAALFWGPVLLVDAVLLLFLAHAHVLALAVLALAAVLFLLRRPRFSLAFVALGWILLQPVVHAFGSEMPVFFLGRVLILGPLFFEAWQRLWDWPARRREWVRLELARQPVLWWAVAIGAVFLIGMIGTPTPVYGLFKSSYYILDNLCLLLAAAVLLRAWDAGEEAERGVRFFQAIVFIQLLIAGTAVWNWFTHAWPFTTRLVTLGVHSIHLGREMSAGLLSLLVLRSAGRLRAVYAAPLAVLFLWVLYQTGARGPILAFGLALAFWIATIPGRAGRNLRPLLGASILLLAAAAVFYLPEVAADRFSPLAGREASNAVRLHLLQLARDAIREAWPFGLGTGGFTTLLKLHDVRYFPHNIFAELYLENGVLGLTLLILFLGAMAARYLRARGLVERSGAAPVRRTLIRAAGAMLVFNVAMAQVSGDVITNDLIWLWAGALLAFSARPAAEPGGNRGGPPNR